MKRKHILMSVAVVAVVGIGGYLLGSGMGAFKGSSRDAFQFGAKRAPLVQQVGRLPANISTTINTGTPSAPATTPAGVRVAGFISEENTVQFIVTDANGQPTRVTGSYTLRVINYATHEIVGEYPAVRGSSVAHIVRNQSGQYSLTADFVGGRRYDIQLLNDSAVEPLSSTGFVWMAAQ